MSEKELLEWHAIDSNVMFTFEVTDRFGSYGLTGLAGMSYENECADVTDFVVSCRVIGRGVEEVMMSVLIDHASKMHKNRLVAEFHFTERNEPCRRFFDEKSKLERLSSSERVVYSWDLLRAYVLPTFVTVEKRENSASG